MISDFQKQDHASGGRAPAHTFFTPEVGYYLRGETYEKIRGILWENVSIFSIAAAGKLNIHAPIVNRALGLASIFCHCVLLCAPMN